MRCNIQIRDEAFRNRVPLWELADRLGVSETTIYRRLRRELSKEDTEKALEAIRTIVAERGENQ